MSSGLDGNKKIVHFIKIYSIMNINNNSLSHLIFVDYYYYYMNDLKVAKESDFNFDFPRQIT